MAPTPLRTEAVKMAPNIGEEGRRITPACGGPVQGAHHVVGLGGDKGPGRNAQAGVVVDHVQDLEDHPVRHLDVGDVGLPALVGQIGHEALVGGLRTLVGLGGDEAPGLEDPPDSGYRRHRRVALGEVVVDGLGPGVDPEVAELLSKSHDLLLIEVGNPRRRPLRPPRAWLESGVTLPSVAGEQLVEPAAVHPVRPGKLSKRPPSPKMRLDQESALVHRRPSPLGVSYVLTQVSPMS